MRRIFIPALLLSIGTAQLSHAGAAQDLPGDIPEDSAETSPWPFDPPPLADLRKSPKKVFAHYFTPFPISIDNEFPSRDYYALQHLSPAGEHEKYLSQGGYLRERPLPQLPRPDEEWRLRNLEDEIRSAVAIGLDGFTCDLLSTDGPGWDNVLLLLQAAANVDPGFKIVLMPDMDTAFGRRPELLADAILELSKYPAAYRLDDGRLVVAPFNAHRQPASWWTQWLAQMHSAGADVAFVPLFQGWRSYAKDYQPISYGFTDWGMHSAQGNRGDEWKHAAAEAHQFVPLWMAPVTPQDMRPKNSAYWESSNSLNYRLMWENAILGGADWVHVITWNDYSEATEISPSTGTQYAFYDLTAYYIAWFKTGRAPVITRDVLYYFHRLHSTAARPNASADPFKLRTEGRAAKLSWLPRLLLGWLGVDVDELGPRNEIELLAFLTEPGRLRIDVGGESAVMDAPAWITSFRTPLAKGRPRFRLMRDGETVIDFDSAFDISKSIEYPDLLYRGGSSSRPPLNPPAQIN